MGFLMNCVDQRNTRPISSKCSAMNCYTTQLIDMLLENVIAWGHIHCVIIYWVGLYLHWAYTNSEGNDAIHSLNVLLPSNYFPKVISAA